MLVDLFNYLLYNFLDPRCRLKNSQVLSYYQLVYYFITLPVTLFQSIDARKCNNWSYPILLVEWSRDAITIIASAHHIDKWSHNIPL